MTYQSLIEQFCLETEQKMNFGQQEKQHLVFTIEIKPGAYFVPDIRLGTKSYPPAEPALWAEVFLNGVCLFRESFATREGVYTDEDKDTLCHKLLSNIFAMGIAESYTMIQKRQWT